MMRYQRLHQDLGAWQRTNRHQLMARRGLYDCLCKSLDSAGIPWEACEAEDRGDGVFILAPPEVPKCLFVESLPERLADALNEHNELHSSDITDRALEMWREIGDRWSEARTLTALGDVSKELGHIDSAHESWCQALVICHELGAPQTAEIQARLAERDGDAPG